MIAAKEARREREHLQRIVDDVLNCYSRTELPDIGLFDLKQICLGWESAQHAAAQVKWVPIRSAEDLPKEDGDYLWQDSAQGYDIQYFCTERNPEQYLNHDYIAWQKINPYIEQLKEAV